MNIADLYLKLLLLVVAPLAVGMALAHRSWSRPLATRLFRIALYVFHTAIALLAVWQAELANKSWMLPFIALTGWLISMGVAAFGNRWMKHTPQQKGSFLFTICLSNHGYTLLGIVAFVAFGEAGLAQATYTQLFITPFLIMICFPIARFHGGESRSESLAHFLKTNLLDNRNLPLLAMIAGLTLNVTGIERPAFLSPLVPVVVYTGTLISGTAVGLLFSAGRIMNFVRENLFSFVYRSTLYPLFFYGVAALLGMNGLDTRILLLFGIAPSAVFSNLIADLFQLDKDLTNSVYIISTLLFLLISLPIYLMILSA